MMDKNISSLIEFVNNNLNVETSKLLLNSKNRKADFDLNFAICQISSRKKHREKLRSFLLNKYFLFPDKISGEQASHEAVAKFHASLAKQNEKVLDMTAGLGIDAFCFGEKVKSVTTIDIDPNKSAILEHNRKILGLTNLNVICKDSIEYLIGSNIKFDLIFIDPSRRDSNNNRIYNLKDCLPDVVSNQSLMKSKSERILIKASPMIDISQTLRDLNNIKAIMAIGIKGECKEILIEIDSCNHKSTTIEAINLDKDGQVLSRFATEYPSPSENRSIIEYASLKEISKDKFILEPSAMIMKISPWKDICQKFKAKKLGVSSNLFISSEYPSEFPGRVTAINRIIKKQDWKTLKDLPATAVSKNHPLSSDQLRKSLDLREGDQYFLYATKIEEKPVIILSKAVQKR